MFRKKKTIKDSLIEIGVDVSKPIGAYILKELADLGYVKLVIRFLNDGLDIWINLGDENNLDRAVAIIYATGIQHEYGVWASDKPVNGRFNTVKTTYNVYGSRI